MTLKKTTFKQRIQKNGMKSKQKVTQEMRKRMRLGKRRHNRFDEMDIASRPLDELVDEIAQGSAIPARELNLDPRSLADLLLRPDSVSARPTLPTTPLPADDPCALPEVDEADTQTEKREVGGAAKNKNQYKHHGDPYLFWERVGLHPLLMRALRSMRFTHPTPVQEEVLPSVLVSLTDEADAKRKSKRQQKDVIISAETGSGKTLAFALPILQHVLTNVAAPPVEESQAEGEGDEENENKAENKVEEQSVTKSSAHSNRSERKKLKALQKTKSNGRKRMREADDQNEDEHDEEEHQQDKNEGKTKKKTNKKSTKKSENGKAPPKEMDRLMQALIISPTRELALQINEAMLQLIQHAPHIVIGCVVGGMAPEKQQRVLNRHPHVLICTPGRLWELVQKNEGCYLGHSISRRLAFVVLDEADKLLQSGRFEELKNLIERIHCEVLPAGFVQDREVGAEAGMHELEAGRWDEATQSFIPFTRANDNDSSKDNTANGAAKTRRKDEPRLIAMPPDPPEDHRVITFVTSATISLQTNYERRDLRAKKTVIRTSNADTMGTVLQQLQIKPSGAHVFTVTPKADVAAKIQETYLRCPGESKDLYLYYFLKMYRERTIIFVNAISMLRRLVKILDVLGIPVAGLHASLQQRQRLKYIDKFRSGEKRVLVATDIASRGLDVDGLKYVIHFQVPRTTDAYIHRCGRTARCGGTGLSVLLINAQEHVSFKKLMESLGRDAGAMEAFALQPTVVHQLHPHVRTALQIDKLQKEIDKSRAQNTWARRMSREADIDVDDLVNDEVDDENRAKEKAIKALKKQLDLLIKKHMGAGGGKGGFRSSAQAIGAKKAESKLVERATLQTTQKGKNKNYGETAHSGKKKR